MTNLLAVPRLQNVFGDKSSLVIRALLRSPDRHWTARQLAAEGVSLGLVSAVLRDLDESGYVARTAHGRFSYSVLKNPEDLLTCWTQYYRFHKNPQAHFFSSDPDLLPKLRAHLEAKGAGYALTVFSGANLLSPYVVNNDLFLYLDVPHNQAEKFLWDIQAHFNLLLPRAGANVHLALPLYSSSVFRDSQSVGGYTVVSNLQLYLDLINYPMGGREQAEWLCARLAERGDPLIGRSNSR